MSVHGALVQLVAYHTGVRGAEMNVAPVGHLPKAKVNRKPAEQRSTGHGSAMRDYCEADRANEMSETAVRIGLDERLCKSSSLEQMLEF